MFQNLTHNGKWKQSSIGQVWSNCQCLNCTNGLDLSQLGSSPTYSAHGPKSPFQPRTGPAWATLCVQPCSTWARPCLVMGPDDLQSEPQTVFSAWSWTFLITMNLPDDLRQVSNRNWTQLPPLGLPYLTLLGTVGLDPGWWGPHPARHVITAGAAGPHCIFVSTVQLMIHRSNLSKGHTKVS